MNQAGLREQANSLIPLVRSKSPQVVLSSDLLRASETAEIVATALGIPLVIVPALREVYLGAAQGLTTSEVDQEYGVGTWKRWLESSPDTDGMHFPTGESKSEVEARVCSALLGFISGNHYDNIAVCGHGFSMSRLWYRLGGMTGDGLELRNELPYYFEISWDANTDLKLRSIAAGSFRLVQ